MDDLTREFLIESQEGLDRMERCLTELESKPSDTGLLADIFRTVHTIKGTTGFLDVYKRQGGEHQNSVDDGAVGEPGEDGSDYGREDEADASLPIEEDSSRSFRGRLFRFNSCLLYTSDSTREVKEPSARRVVTESPVASCAAERTRAPSAERTRA